MSASNELTGPAAAAAMKRLTRRGFAIGGAAALLGSAGFAALSYGPQDDGIPWFLRRILGVNEKLSRALFSDKHLAPEFPASRAAEPRVNGRYGLLDTTDAATWRVSVTSDRSERALTIPEVFAGFARVEMVTEFKCVEGWSEVVQWSGVRFSDFAAKFGPPAGIYEYVGMTSPPKPPGGAYYVGLDAASALHPQTLLCDTMNGQPLSAAHGGPLRLVIPVKYGVKNIKQIVEIAFGNRRPRDFWAEQGYDWYLGL